MITLDDQKERSRSRPRRPNQHHTPHLAGLIDCNVDQVTEEGVRGRKTTSTDAIKNSFFNQRLPSTHVRASLETYWYLLLGFMVHCNNVARGLWLGGGYLVAF